jgi:hypothetical protein
MRTVLWLTLGAVAASAGAARADVSDTRMLRQSVPIDAAAPLVVVVGNVFGSIRVTGHDLDRVEMTATETVHGDLRADIDRARAEVELRTESEPGRIAFRVRRIGESGDCECGYERWDDYRVKYDIELRVPRTATVDLATVNAGDITVEDVHGEFTAMNVNGAVRLVGLRGAGRASTVNGDIEAAFERTPTSAASFKTVNGDLDVAFPADLSAELAFGTLHGEIFTDFDVEALRKPITVERTRDRDLVVMRANRDRSSTFRVRSGGQTHSFNTLNGDIYVRKVAP